MRLEQFRDQGKLLEAQRLEQRTKFDLEMIAELGYCQVLKITHATFRSATW